jgi:hypothetical protein
MSEDEIVVTVFAAIAAVASAGATSVRGLHPLCLERNPGPGLVRLAVIGSMVWLAVVLRFFGDPSIVGIYVAFYLLLGYAVTKFFGQVLLMTSGISLRVDVAERRNWPAALFFAAFTFGTGLIFGGSLWGEADPDSDYEGGWWIPMGFFAQGWLVMAAMLTLYLMREPGRFRTGILQQRNLSEAKGAASFTLSTAILMTSAVAGDFYGWAEGLKDVGLAAAMLVAHEFLRPPTGLPDVGGARRTFECVLYLALAVLNTVFVIVR